MAEKDSSLYRALRKEEIEAGNVLIPKLQKPFKSHPCLGIDTRLPFRLGESEECAVRQHQLGKKEFSTAGVSTTPHLERAKVYARDGVVVKINRAILSEYGVREYIVRDYLGKFPEDIAVPEDEEVILVKEGCSVFPKEIITEVVSD